MSKLPVALLASRLIGLTAGRKPQNLVVVLASEHRAEALARLLAQLDPDLTACFLPAWDCLPYDRAAPSADIMGHRMRVMRELHAGPDRTVLVTTLEAVLQRLPPAAAAARRLSLKRGAPLDPEAFAAEVERLGYVHADRVEDHGQVAIRGEVVDIFPAGARPYRIAMLDGAVVALHVYDPVSQRRGREVERLCIDAVSEVVATADAPVERFPGMEHWLADFYPETLSLLDLLPDAGIVVEPEAEARSGALQDQIQEAYRDRLATDRAQGDAVRKALAPERAFLTAADWTAAVAARATPFPGRDPGLEVPRFAADDKPGKLLGAFLTERLEAGSTVVLGAVAEADLALMAKQARRATGRTPARITRWADLDPDQPGALVMMRLAADRGFADEEDRLALITARDVLGHHARVLPAHAVPTPWHLGEGELAFGDILIHTQHGVGVLRGLERLESDAVADRETVRLTYAHEADLLVPIDDLGQLWRYGSAEDAVALDRLDGDAWQKRRRKIEGEIAETAAALVDMARLRAETAAPRLVPPHRAYERFVEAFPFSPTPDQMHAIDDVLADLGSGRPMDRLVVGDVGFGKTEVALRAAAAAALAGRQVAIVAPTTVLVRQHVSNFQRRFEGLGIEVVQLSRLVAPGEAARVRDGLADGSVRVVVGTQALVGKGVAFKELGLLVVDEEQRFGTADKAKLRNLGAGIHVLTLSATPIPRTLQSALVGLQDLSVIATPPARRRPIRTLVSPYDLATIRTALLREKARGGQSFVVVPRIEDLEPLAHSLVAHMPDLSFTVGHGQMEAHEVEDAMVEFAAGHNDVLVATSIIESGLDVPRANTMVVCNAERFGLAQLHQLRGRVGRGRQQGVCYLMTDPAHPPAEATARRLATLTAFDRLGSGLAISSRDLDMRGAGDIIGDEQAGHMRLIGLGLYQHMLQVAIRAAREEAQDDWSPEINLDAEGTLPADYIPEPEVRLNLYARLARVVDAQDAEVLEQEIEDRFGPLPEPVSALLAVARLQCLCRSIGVSRIDAGPKAIAFTLRPGVSAEALIVRVPDQDRDVLSFKEGRFIFARNSGTAAERLALAANLLGELH